MADIRAGRTLWSIGPNPETGELEPQDLVITGGLQRLAPGTWTMEVSRVSRKVSKENFPADREGDLIIDKLFVTKKAALRWLKRRESNRLETLCEDRRVFVRGSKLLRQRYQLDDLLAAKDNMFAGLQVDLYSKYLERDIALWIHALDRPELLARTQD